MKFDLVKSDGRVSAMRHTLERFSLTGENRVLSRIEREFHPLALEIEHTPPAPLPRVLLWVLSALTVSCLAWSYLSKIDVVSTAKGRVIPDGRLKVLQSVDNATVKAIYVKEGAHVQQGQVLVDLDPTVSNVDLASSGDRAVMIRLELIRLNAELTGTRADYAATGGKPENILLQETLKAARVENYLARISEARNDLRSKEMAKAAAEDTLRKIADNIKSASEKEARVRPYVGTVMTRFDYLRLKDDLTQNESDAAYQRNRIKDLEEQSAGAAQRIRQIEQEYKSKIVSDINDAMTRLTSVNAEFEKATQFSTQKQLRAPVEGTIQALGITTVGGVVSATQTLATIVPKGTPLIVEVQLSNEDIGFVKIGQQVDLKLDAFPFQKYGTVPGVVTSISPDAEQDGEAARNGNSNNQARGSASYRAQIKPAANYVAVNGTRQNILSGMALQADIKTDRRRIIEFFTSPVLKYLDEGLKVR